MLLKKFSVTKEKSSSVLVLVALAFAVLFEGGFYWQHTIIPYALFAVCICLLFKKANAKINAIFLLSALLLTLSLLTSMGCFQQGLYESEKILLFFAAICIGSMLDKKSTVIEYVFYLSVAVAVIGILAYSFLLQSDSLVLYDRGTYRLQSVFGYANATAAFLGCGYFAFMSSYQVDGKAYKKGLGSCILLALFLTVSKAAIPIFLLVGTVYAFRNEKARTLFVFQNVIALIFAVVISALTNGVFNPLVLLLSLVCAIAGIYAIPKENSKYFKIWIALLLVGAIVFAILIFSGVPLFSTIFRRFEYMRDSLSLLQNNLILGSGAASFRALQYSVQTEPYSVAHIHNGFLEFAVENGIVFAILFAALVIFASVLAWKRKMNCIFSILAFVSFHSLVDCDFSFASVLLVMGLSVGSAFSASGCFNKKENTLLSRVTAVAVCLVLVLACGYMTAEYTARSEFEKSYLSGDMQLARECGEKLEKIAPLDSELQVSLAALDLGNGDTDSVQARLQKAVELSPNDPTVYADYLKYCYTKDNFKTLCGNYIRMAPLQEATYSFLIELVKGSSGVSDSEKASLVEYIVSERKHYGVVDRNEYLKELIDSGNY